VEHEAKFENMNMSHFCFVFLQSLVLMVGFSPGKAMPSAMTLSTSPQSRSCYYKLCECAEFWIDDQLAFKAGAFFSSFSGQRTPRTGSLRSVALLSASSRRTPSPVTARD